MTLSISDQPSQWHRITKRHSLLSDATIDPFPHQAHRTASLLDHHIVRDGLHDAPVADDGRQTTAPYLPHPHAPPRLQQQPPPPPPPLPPSSIAPLPSHPPLDSRYFAGQLHDARKRSIQEMTAPDISEGSSSPTSTGQVEGGNQFCLCQPEPKIPRPRNAFILYRQHQQAGVVRANPGLPNPAISKIIGEQWSRLPEAAKNEWKALAEEEKARHAQQYPDYRYQPRRNGRYSSQSSGSGPPSGGQVDAQGNCKKCGGKTMNPPTTPYNPCPTTPRGTTRGPQPTISPPQSSRPPYPDRHWPPAPPRFDPRDPRNHDPRARYQSMAEGMPDAPDLKRRRFDGNGIYIPTREWREAPYQFSPRGSFFRNDVPPEAHCPSLPAGPRLSYAQPPPAAHAPRLSLVRPPPPTQQKRDPSLTLAPLTTPTTMQPPSSASSASGMEAMIMSIPVINKVKILSQISPHLPPLNSMSSPSQEVRGSVVAIEGMDPATVFSMTNSLAEELERDGKFAVRIFGGPDPYALRDQYGRSSKRLSIADTLGVIGEWHTISEEMKRFISTRVSPTSKAAMATSTRTTSIEMADAPTQVDTHQTPDHLRTSGNATVVGETNASGSHEQRGDQAAISLLSPRTVAQTADLKLATPPSHRPQFGNRASSLSVFPGVRNAASIEAAPYTRIPAAAMQRPSTPPRTTRSTTSATAHPDRSKQFDTAPPPRTASISSHPPTPSTAGPATPLTPSAPSHGASNQPPSSPGLVSETPIPIALVPHYQLTTVDSAAITLPINDSYSPLAHWQWLATLWRGCVGPDVSIVIKGPAGSIAEGASGAVAAVAAEGDSAKGSAGGTGHEGVVAKEKATGEGQGRDGQGARSSNASAGVVAGSEKGSVSAAAGSGQGQGVDVRLLECRAVVVRIGGLGGTVKDARPAASAKDRENAEFWEKAKRRVGFEVGEFLRR